MTEEQLKEMERLIQVMVDSNTPNLDDEMRDLIAEVRRLRGENQQLRERAEKAEDLLSRYETGLPFTEDRW